MSEADAAILTRRLTRLLTHVHDVLPSEVVRNMGVSYEDAARILDRMQRRGLLWRVPVKRRNAVGVHRPRHAYALTPAALEAARCLK